MILQFACLLALALCARADEPLYPVMATATAAAPDASTATAAAPDAPTATAPEKKFSPDAPRLLRFDHACAGRCQFAPSSVRCQPRPGSGSCPCEQSIVARSYDGGRTVATHDEKCALEYDVPGAQFTSSDLWICYAAVASDRVRISHVRMLCSDHFERAAQAPAACIVRYEVDVQPLDYYRVLCMGAFMLVTYFGYGVHAMTAVIAIFTLLEVYFAGQAPGVKAAYAVVRPMF